jgi:hypothetical protein
LRWVRVVLVLGGIAIGVRLVLGFMLAGAIDALIRPRGIECAWEDLDLAILSGRGEMHGLRFSFCDKDPGDPSTREPIVAVDYAVFDLEVLPLLVGKLRVQRLEVDGALVDVARSADGSWDLARCLAPSTTGVATTSGQEPKGSPSGEPEISLAPPFVIAALRFQDVYVHLSDATFDPPLERRLHVDAGITDLWRPGRNMRFAATVTGEKILDGAHVEGEADWTRERIALDLRAQLGGLRPRALAPYLEELAIQPACEAVQGELTARLEVGVTGDSHDAVRGSLDVTDVRLSADGVDSLAVDRVQVDLDSMTSAEVALPRIEVSGARANVSLEAPDSLRIAGLDVAMTAEETSHAPWINSVIGVFDLWLGQDVPAWASLFVHDDPHAYRWSLGELTLRGAEFHAVDHRVEPPAEFPVFVDEVSVKDLVHAPIAAGAPRREFPLHAEMRVPGTVESIRVDGSIAPLVPDRAIDLTIDAQGLEYAALAGYLRSAGLEDTERKGGLHLKLVGEAKTDADGATDGNLALEETLTLDGGEASQLGSVRATGLRIDPANDRVRLGDIEISGTRILLARDPSRRLVAFGLRTLGLSATPQPEETAPVSTGPEGSRMPTAPAAVPLAVAPHLPRVEIGRLAWTDNKISFVDETQDPPLQIDVDPIGFELSNLTVGGTAGDPDPEPGRFVARARSAGVFEELALEGTIHSKLGGIDVKAELDFAGAGLTGRLIAPYMRAIGLEPALTDARAGLHVQAELKQTGSWSARLRLQDGELADADATVLKLGALSLDDITETAGGVSIGSIEVVEPYARIERPAAGGFRAGGLLIVGKPEEGKPTQPEAPAPLAYPALPDARVGELAVRGARLSIHDGSFEPAIDTDIELECTGKDLSTRGEQGTLVARLAIPGTVASAEARCAISIDPTHASIGTQVEMSGVQQGAAARWLPPGMSVDTSDGRLSAAATIELGDAPDGGLRARVAAQDVSWRDGESEPIFACRRASLEVPRIDPVASTLELGPIEVDGLALDVERDEQGAMHALGLRVGSAESGASPAVEAEPDPGSADPAHTSFAHVRLAGDVALSLESLRFRDASLGPGARPIELGVEAHIPGPLELLGEDSASLSPIVWSIDSFVGGLVEQCRIDGSLRLFGDEPGIDVTLAASGVRTQGLVEIVPSLGERMHGDVEQGTLEGRLDARLDLHHARSGDLGLDRPFGGEAKLDHVAFRAEPDGDVIAGMDAMDVDFATIDLEKNVFHIKQIEITRPGGLARRIGDELSVCGFSIGLVPEDTETHEPESAVQASAVEASASRDREGDAALPPRTEDPAPVTAAPSPAQGEVRIDRLLVSGVAAELRDLTRDPAVVIPLAGLDIEAGPITTRAMSERVPMHFHAVVEGGAPMVPGLEKPLGAPVFEEFVLAGDIALAPEPSGRLQLSLTALQLPEVVALAPPQAVDVTDGALDLRVQAKIRGGSGARVNSMIVFTDLDVKEPAGGPIESGFDLPVALDSALFLLRNPAGEHRFTVGFTVEEGGISPTQIALAAAGAAAQVLASALVGAPMRLLSAIVPSSGKEQSGPRAVSAVPFAAGSCDFTPESVAAFRGLCQDLEADPSLALVIRHELGAEDVKRAEQLANPSETECTELVARARQRKAELLRDRAKSVIRARTLLAVGAPDATRASDALRGIDRELAGVEGTLDSVLEILRSPSERQANKRTRVAALDIAQCRLDAITELARRSLYPSSFARLDIRAPRFEVTAGEGAGRIVLELRQR